MKHFFLLVLFVINGAIIYAQPSDPGIARPRLVVGIVIDQMRWDYLYRYYSVFKPDGGFKRLLNNGFTCDNTLIPYTPTVTACGHTCVYTGSVPAIHGITGNEWFDNIQNRTVYCSEDNAVETVGAAGNAGKMSPRNMITTTVTDELRLATNFQSKVIGIAIKDRGAILPAGHAANAAYWYDYASGNFITSTYYMNELPAWVQQFNGRKIVDSLFKLNWNLSLPKDIYEKNCTLDAEPYEHKPFGGDQPAMPYDLTRYVGKSYSMIAATPQGNTLTAEMAKAALLAEKLGSSGTTDFLAISFSSPDYIGHSFGPNSWEQLDDFVKLDDVLGNFLDFLDANVGKDQYSVFLTADHGVAHVPLFSQEHKLPGGPVDMEKMTGDLNGLLKQQFGKDPIITGIYNYQLVFDNRLIKSSKLDRKKIIQSCIDYLQQQDVIAQAFDLGELSGTTLNSTQKQMTANGYFPIRSGDVQLILKPGYVEGDGIGTSHGLWNPYDSHIPLLWYGWGIKHGKTNRETYMTDIAATVAALLHIQMPSGSVGKVIEEVMIK